MKMGMGKVSWAMNSKMEPFRTDSSDKWGKNVDLHKMHPNKNVIVIGPLGTGRLWMGEDFENNALLNRFQRELSQKLVSLAQSNMINHMKTIYA